ncbi:hypothetical protein HHK36_025975 [Tetracentron sinense]|uniref:MATH domain-containing protein n=1 Tax=Tetracentron sinense TaxID=13715 RepID=A0A835D639_TETSI|nr:hypothetical protein HHK36_025975 [Tetracentron sinense]
MGPKRAAATASIQEEPYTEGNHEEQTQLVPGKGKHKKEDTPGGNISITPEEVKVLLACAGRGQTDQAERLALRDVRNSPFFSTILTFREALAWFHRLPRWSINDSEQLNAIFLNRYITNKRKSSDVDSLFAMTIKGEESLSDFIQKFREEENDYMLVSQPMDVAQAETASTMENQLVEDPPFSRFTWTIENFSRLNTKDYYSETFFVGSYKWRVLIFPKGDNLSMYLDVADSTNLPYGWSRYAKFSLAVVNQIHEKNTIRKDTQHQFNEQESGWGFLSFMPFSELYDPRRGYLVNDTCIVEAKVSVRRNDTEGNNLEPLIVNDEETMVVEVEPQVEAIISAEGITEEPAITNDEKATVVKIQNVYMETIDTGAETAAEIESTSEMPSNDQVSEVEVTTEAVLVEENQIELDSIVNKYPISETHKSTWRDIVKKYGDITHKSNTKNSKMKAACIETICDIISVLKATPAQGLKMTIINQCESDLEEVEITKMDVSWLKERLHMLKTILAQSILFSVMGDSLEVKTEKVAKLTASIAEDNSKIEDARKEIAKQEALIMDSLESLKVKKEELKTIRRAKTSQHEEFESLRTASEKLLYYGTKGFTLDLF